jgi:hypothetical protein
VALFSNGIKFDKSVHLTDIFWDIIKKWYLFHIFLKYEIFFIIC